MVDDAKILNRIAVDSGTMTGKPVIRGTRLTVELILNLLAHGTSISKMLGEYKWLTGEDIRACILFAAKTVEDSSFMPLTAAVA